MAKVPNGGRGHSVVAAEASPLPANAAAPSKPSGPARFSLSQPPTMPSASIRQALHAAVQRGVDLTLLLERNADNPGFGGSDDPFPRIAARRLAWPANARAAGASMHAKVLVVDRKTALVGSANLTGHALERNLECGLLVRGGPVPALLAGHLLGAQGLRDAGTLTG
jgi:phosphatidylserine/phosphatidylglycerophosphate/cardiolipin synthase-like enzyme